MTFVVVILSVLAIYGFTNFMIAEKLLAWVLTVSGSFSPVIFYVIYSICALSIPAAFILPNSLKIRKHIALLSYYWMGIYFYLLLIIPISAILLGICFRFGFASLDLQPRVILMTGWIIFFVILATMIYGRMNANNIKLNCYEVTINKHTGIKGLKIVLISDIHFNIINNHEHLSKVVKEINSINPDIVCLAGDIFDGDYNAMENPEKMQELLKSIQPKYGTYASLGNHDAGKTYSEMIEFLEESSVTVLYDNYTIVDNQFVIAGRRDSSPIGNQGEKRVELMGREILYKDLPIIVLDHQPSNITEYDSEIDLVLCGHTHKGQMFPANYITKAIFEVDYGYYQKDQSSPHIIVSSGVGTWGPPLRIGTNNEVVSIDVFFSGKE